jgi:hypothetical protein
VIASEIFSVLGLIIAGWRRPTILRAIAEPSTNGNRVRLSAGRWFTKALARFRAEFGGTGSGNLEGVFTRASLKNQGSSSLTGSFVFVGTDCCDVGHTQGFKTMKARLAGIRFLCFFSEILTLDQVLSIGLQ